MKSSFKIGIAFLVGAIAAVAGASVFSMQKTTNSARSPSVPTITISYHLFQAPCGHWATDINITNQGYPSFNTDPTKFSIIVAGVSYGYSASLTNQGGMWDTTNVSNQGTCQGTLLFDTTSNATSASLSYNDASYNIVYEVK